MLTTAVAPTLGRLASPPGRGGDDDLRIELVDRLVAPGAAEQGGAWVVAWRATAEALAERILAEASADLHRAATHARYPTGRLASLLPDGQAREVLVERLTAEGMELERLEQAAPGAATVRMRGAALEAAWDAAQVVARAERSRWLAAATDVDGWRRPWRPLVIAAASATVLLVVLAAWIGGWLPAPTWFRPVVDAFWRLPWP